MAFEPENKLEIALVKAAKDVLARPEFYHCLMSEPVVVAGELVRAGDGVSEGMNLAVMRHNGRPYHPIFSSFTRLKAISKAEIHHFAMVGRDLFTRTKGADFLLNPGSEIGKPLSPTEIAFWLDPSARAQRRLLKNPPMAKVANLAEPPRALIESLRVLFANRRDIVRAHILEVSFSDRNEPPHPLIVIETEGNWDKVSGEVGELSAAILPDVLIDIIRFDPSDPDAGLLPFIANSKPFYQREVTE